MHAHKTPLYQMHVKSGAKMTEFAGWLLPLWYETGQSREHHATRQACGLFDICHMGEFEITGPGARPFLSRILTNHVDRIQDGQALYNFMLNEAGGVIDDCILYRFSEERWMLVVNAANLHEDWNWLKRHAPGNVVLENISNQTVKIDLQGPNAPKLMNRWIAPDTLSSLKFFRTLDYMRIDGIPVMVSRTGYTGEIGFELYTDSGNGVDLWNLLIQEGGDFGLLPCGLGARDTLRIEAGLPLHGHELRPDCPALGHPWEFVFDWEKAFIGKEALLSAKQTGLSRFVSAFRLSGRRKAMPGWKVILDGEEAGQVLSGVLSPTLENAPIGFLETTRPVSEGTSILCKQPERELEVEGEICTAPFVPLTARKKMADFL
ncbi:glycine cleavage system aminomethyltransferase GcvT [bacterium]|nr:glycine cleavage system aminomethyltransferase GcvT [bacterium]